MLCVLELNAWREFLGDANATFQQQEQIIYPDPRQTCLNDFVLFLLDRLRDHGAVDAVPPTEVL
jgi:hypothetical protein